jgi:hypothetical protein
MNGKVVGLLGTIIGDFANWLTSNYGVVTPPPPPPQKAIQNNQLLIFGAIAIGVILLLKNN